MGNISSITKSASLPSGDANASVLDGYNLGTPTAAVIGAGIAGVHVAYELARLGFAVTVYDERTSVASGATRYSLPFVGMGLLEPSLLQADMRKEFLRALLPIPQCPNIITSDHRFNTLLNPTLYRWLWGRYRALFTEREVMWYTDNLSRLSVNVVNQLTRDHVALQNSILGVDIPVQQLRPSADAGSSGSRNNSAVAVPAAVASPSVVMLDPVHWTQTLAVICRDKLGVRFALGEKVEGLHTYLKYDTVCTRAIDVSKPSDDGDGKRTISRVSYDVVVIAAGANSGLLTWNSARLPIIGLGGVSTTVEAPAKAVTAPDVASPGERSSSSSASSLEPLAKVFATTTASPTAASSAAAALYNPSSLYAYLVPGRTAASGQRAQAYHLQGLLSLDTTAATSAGSSVAAACKKYVRRLESCLRVKCNMEVPLSEGDAAVSVSDVEPYVRAFTPDGVPLVDHSGGSFNTFICSGFGDHAVDFAPGAAKILSKLVELRAHDLLRENQLHAAEEGIEIARTALPVERTAAIKRELAGMFDGTPASKGRVASTEANEGALANPFATTRFAGLVKTDFSLKQHQTVLDRFYNAETWLMEKTDPVRHAMNRKLIELARKDDMPAWFRKLIFNNFFEESDDAAYMINRPLLEKGMERLAEKYEKGVPDTATIDKQNVLSKEEQMRKMFSN